MLSTSLRRTLVLVILGLILAGPWASALEARAPSPPGQVVSLGEATRGFLGLLWSTLTGAWQEEGATLDPSGVKRGNGLVGDSGATLDPSGLAGDNGATLDPNGRK